MIKKVLCYSLILFSFVLTACNASSKQNESSINSNDNSVYLNEYEYRIEDNNITIISHRYNAESSEITVPKKIENVPVTVLEKDSFYQHKNTVSIILPQNLTTIIGSPFYKCYSLKEILIPKYVKQIDTNPFFRCPSLTKIIVDPDNSHYTDIEGVLFNKDKTVLISYPEGKLTESYLIPKSVRELKIDSFGYKTKLKEITILSNVTIFPKDNMFVFPDNITLIVEQGSKAEEYAKEYNINFKIITN